MKYEVTVSVKKTYEIEADDIAQAVNEGLDIFKSDSDVSYSVSAINREDYYTPEQVAYQCGVSLKTLVDMIIEGKLPAVEYNNNYYIPKSYKDIK